MNKYITWLKNTNNFYFIVVLSTLAIILKMFFATLTVNLLNFSGISVPDWASLENQIPEITVTMLYVAVFFAPVFETLVSQTLPILGIGALTKNTKILMFSSAFIFAILHFPVVTFFLTAFILGLIFAWAFIVKKEQYGVIKATFIVILIHLLHNLSAFGFVYLTQN